MADRRTQAFFLMLAAIMSGLLLAYFFMRVPEKKRPTDLQGLAAWLAEHPSDWRAASAVADAALDAPTESRFELWRKSHELAVRLSPHRPQARHAFLRSGLFHWYELPERDRRAVLQAAEPLLREPKTFTELHRPLYELTRNFSLLRRANPGTVAATFELAELAAAYGAFDDYRALRAELVRKHLADFAARHATATQSELLGMLPARLDASYDPLVRSILAELQRRPLESDGHVNQQHLDVLIDYAVRHQLHPLDGLEVVLHHPMTTDPQRARLALALGNREAADDIEIGSTMIDAKGWSRYHIERARHELKRGDPARAFLQIEKAAAGEPSADTVLTTAAIARERGDSETATQRERELVQRFGSPANWVGLCGRDLCSAATTEIYAAAPTTATLHVATVQTDDVAPYVEIYVDDVLVTEGPVTPRRDFAVPLQKAGVHRVEVRLPNRFTRNRVERRVSLGNTAP